MSNILLFNQCLIFTHRRSRPALLKNPVPGGWYLRRAHSHYRLWKSTCIQHFLAEGESLPVWLKWRLHWCWPDRWCRAGHWCHHCNSALYHHLAQWVHSSLNCNSSTLVLPLQYYVLVSGTLTKMEVIKGSSPGIVAAWFSVLDKYENFLILEFGGFGVGQSTASTCLAVKPCSGFVKEIFHLYPCTLVMLRQWVARLKMWLDPRHVISLVLPVLCDLVPPIVGNSAFKECSDVTTIVLQINACRN